MSAARNRKCTASIGSTATPTSPAPVENQAAATTPAPTAERRYPQRERRAPQRLNY